jgi:phenylalanyl-tRNA synthetase alpha chain
MSVEVEAPAVEAPTPEALRAVQAEFARELEAARAEAFERANGDGLVGLRSAFFGPKGRLTLMLRAVGKLPPEERREAGARTNQLKQALEGELSSLVERFEVEARARELRRSRLDLTLPGRRAHPRGRVHPVNRVVREMVEIFTRMGFELATGPEVELDQYNFEALNFPADHPARDMQDTFFVRAPGGAEEAPASRELLLRTHTSPVQIRAMERQGAPIRIIAPGRVYRCDSDATHSPMFHQIEGLWVDEGVSMAHLKGVITGFVHAMFGARPVRFRPSFFPFVEPGAEVDIGCIFCGGSGCRVCKQTGWMEILGCGMVHPRVLEACKVDPERYTGFAFGIGIDRLAMQRWGIDELGHLFRSDLRFLEQL